MKKYKSRFEVKTEYLEGVITSGKEFKERAKELTKIFRKDYSDEYSEKDVYNVMLSYLKKHPWGDYSPKEYLRIHYSEIGEKLDEEYS